MRGEEGSEDYCYPDVTLIDGYVIVKEGEVRSGVLHVSVDSAEILQVVAVRKSCQPCCSPSVSEADSTMLVMGVVEVLVQIYQ